MFKKSALFAGLLALVVLVGCSSPFDRLKTAYESGNYYEISKAISDGVANTEMRPKVLQFVQDHAKEIERGVIAKGDQLIDQKSEEGIQFHDAMLGLLSVLQNNQIVGFDYPKLSKLMASKKQTAINVFVDDQTIQGNANLTGKSFRAANANYRNAAKYILTGDLERKIQTSKKLAKRQVGIMPFATPTRDVGITDVINIFTKGKTDFDKNYLDYGGINVNDEFSGVLQTTLNRAKSEYLGISIDLNPSESDFLNYFVTGQLTGHELEGRKSEIVASTNVSYRTYVIKLTAQGKIYLKNTNKSVYSFSLSSEAQDSDRDGELDRAKVVRAAVTELSQNLSNEILGQLDHDLDPYSEYVQIKK